MVGSLHKTSWIDGVAGRRIGVYGAGGSGVVGVYLAFLLMRWRRTAQAFTDPSLAAEVANGLDDRSVAIGVSLTGVAPTPSTSRTTHAFPGP